MADQKPILWQWRIRPKPETPRGPWFSHKTWKQLRWRMTEEDATEWVEKNGCQIEKVAGSEMRITGQYLGFTGPVNVTPAPGKEQ